MTLAVVRFVDARVFCIWSLFSYAVLSVLSIYAITLMRKRELVVFLMSCDLMFCAGLFLTVQCVGLQCYCGISWS